MFIFAYQLSQLVWGPTTYQGITRTLQSPAFLAFDVVVLIFAMLHSITWIQLNILVVPTKIGKIRLNRTLLLGGGIIAWLIVSGIVAMLILTG